MKFTSIARYLLPLSIIIVGALFIVTISVSKGSAQAAQQSGQAFSISPPLIELQSDPGKLLTAKIKLTNISSGDLLIKTQLNDFGAKNETGEPNIIFDDVNNSSYSLRQWITSPEPFTLASKQSRSIEVKIDVPPDAEPGGHYAVVRFTGTAPELEQSGVALSASIGSLIMLQVSGDIKSSAAVEDFFTANSAGDKRGFFESSPIYFAERIRNDGNIHIKPTGSLTVKDMFGRTVSTLRVNGDPQDSDNPPKSTLPNSIRRFDQQLDKSWMFGKYQAEINLEYDDGKTLTDTVTFWVIPYRLIVLALAGLAVIVLAAIFGIRKYNAYIIRKAGRRR